MKCKTFAEAILAEPEGLTKEEEDFVDDFCSDEEPKHPGIQRVEVVNTDEVKADMICEFCGGPVPCKIHDLNSD